MRDGHITKAFDMPLATAIDTFLAHRMTVCDTERCEYCSRNSKHFLSASSASAFSVITFTERACM